VLSSATVLLNSAFCSTSSRRACSTFSLRCLNWFKRCSSLASRCCKAFWVAASCSTACWATLISISKYWNWCSRSSVECSVSNCFTFSSSACAAWISDWFLPSCLSSMMRSVSNVEICCWFSLIWLSIHFLRLLSLSTVTAAAANSLWICCTCVFKVCKPAWASKKSCSDWRFSCRYFSSNFLASSQEVFTSASAASSSLDLRI